MNQNTIDYEQSLCFLIVRRERSEKNRPRESWPHESCCLDERRKKKGTTDKASAFDLCVAPTTQKCDWLMLDSDESDDRPKLTGRQGKGNNWIAVKEGIHLKAVFQLGIKLLKQISRLRYKQSRISMLISHIYVLGCCVNFLVIFRYIWR